jgi:hypothetical protein
VDQFLEDEPINSFIGTSRYLSDPTEKSAEELMKFKTKFRIRMSQNVSLIAEVNGTRQVSLAFTSYGI